MSLEGDLRRLEKQVGQPNAPYWDAPIVEIRPGDSVEDADARLDAVRKEAEAAGWEPSMGPYVIEVDLRGGE